MDGESRPVEVAVGLLVLLGFAALLFLALRVSSPVLLDASETYEVTAAFNNIGGLTRRSPVKIGGVRIGQVTDIGYDSDRFQAIVTMELDARYDNLPTDTSASILTSGLLGEQYIGLEPGAALDSLSDGGEITLTQSALVLEDLIGQFLYNQGGGGSGGQ